MLLTSVLVIDVCAVCCDAARDAICDAVSAPWLEECSSSSSDGSPTNRNVAIIVAGAQQFGHNGLSLALMCRAKVSQHSG